MTTLKFVTQTLAALCLASSAYAADMMKDCDQTMGSDCMKKMDMMKKEMQSDNMKNMGMMEKEMQSDNMKDMDMMKKEKM